MLSSVLQPNSTNLTVETVLHAASSSSASNHFFFYFFGFGLASLCADVTNSWRNIYTVCGIQMSQETPLVLNYSILLFLLHHSSSSSSPLAAFPPTLSLSLLCAFTSLRFIKSRRDPPLIRPAPAHVNQAHSLHSNRTASDAPPPTLISL